MMKRKSGIKEGTKDPCWAWCRFQIKKASSTFPQTLSVNDEIIYFLRLEFRGSYRCRNWT